MRQIVDVVAALEALAPTHLKEPYDNVGLITGTLDWPVTGILCALDVTEAVIHDAVANRCNCIVAHHPIVFEGIKKLSGEGYVQKAIVAAIKHNIAIYAIHTNLDNVLQGVNGFMANALGLVPEGRRVLQPRSGQLLKLETFVPTTHAESVKTALFTAGAGQLGAYSECSFDVEGVGSFKPSADANPFIGLPSGPRKSVNEMRIEMVFESWNEAAILRTLHEVHPYEMVAYYITALQNFYPNVGSGLLGELDEPLSPLAFLAKLRTVFGTPVVKHTALPLGTIKKVALCGGAGSFLTKAALAAGADAFVTADVKYHEFFDTNIGMLLADVGHFESEQHTIGGLVSHLKAIFPTFAVLNSTVVTNPVQYFFD